MKIAIVNDSLMAVECLRRALEATARHEIAWIAHDGIEAVRCAAKMRPDLILMDLFMPNMDGIAATHEIMSACPCPILIVTGDIEKHAGAAFEAMGCGALDAISTPAYDDWDPLLHARELLSKIDTVDRLSRYQSVRLPDFIRVEESQTNYGAPPPLVVIGASSGGPQALAEVLGAFNSECPAGFVVVQHVDAQFAPALAQWLGGRTGLKVATATEGSRPRAGQVLVAATNDHIVFDEKQYLRYTPWPVDRVYRPSVDVFFKSVADHWNGPVIGVLLTGMGYDGAEGMLALKECGNITLAQDESTCAVFGMPKAARELGAVSKMLPLQDVSAAVRDWVHDCGVVSEE